MRFCKEAGKPKRPYLYLYYTILYLSLSTLSPLPKQTNKPRLPFLSIVLVQRILQTDVVLCHISIYMWKFNKNQIQAGRQLSFSPSFYFLASNFVLNTNHSDAKTQVRWYVSKIERTSISITTRWLRRERERDLVLNLGFHFF